MLIILKELKKFQKTGKNFVNCITDMAIKCTPKNYFESNNPNLKEIWKWLKQ